MTKNQVQINKICLAAIFLALGWLLPFLTGQIPEIGSMLLPMHIPVFLAGFILGPCYGALIGFITPLTRSLIFGMPPIYPTALPMSFELLSYGFISGAMFIFLTKYVKKLPTIANVYISLVTAMVLGRFIWAFFDYLFLIGSDNPFTFIVFANGAYINAWPGILLQLVLIPAIVQLLYSFNLVQHLLPDYAKVFKRRNIKENNTENTTNDNN